MSQPEATLRVGWGQRALGLFVLAVVVAAIGGLRFDMPVVTWVILGLVGAAAGWSSLCNFGDRLHVREDGLKRENVLLGVAGWRRERTAAWAEIETVVDLDGRTLFLTVTGQPRWVLDSFEGMDELRAVLQQNGVPITQRRRPRLRDLGRGANDPQP